MLGEEEAEKLWTLWDPLARKSRKLSLPQSGVEKIVPSKSSDAWLCLTENGRLYISTKRDSGWRQLTEVAQARFASWSPSGDRVMVGCGWDHPGLTQGEEGASRWLVLDKTGRVLDRVERSELVD
ncbi:MAG: hypothetical protein HY319_12975 [Armatimonadetes bacterium]|nr:hypothetical protein [Armatimonadota bacterium]